MQARCGEEGSFACLWVEVQTSAAIVENNIVPQKVAVRVLKLYDLAIFCIYIFKGIEIRVLKNHLYSHSPCSIIHSSQHLGTT